MTKYQGYDVTDGTHKTSIHNEWKTVVAQKKPVRGVTLTIGVFFDGTGNNRENTASRLMQFNECNAPQQGVNQKDAQSCEDFLKAIDKDSISNGSYRGYYSNIHWLNSLYIADQTLSDDQTGAQIQTYISGIGTAAGESDSALGMGLGTSILDVFEGVVTKTDAAIKGITSAILEFMEFNLNPNFCIAKIQFDVFGFSRGAAAARHFANRVMEQDPAIVSAIAKGLRGDYYDGKPSGEVRFLGIFDTVAAIGGISNFFDINGRSNPRVKLELRPSVAKKVFQITAMNEYRYNFSLNSINGMWPELALPGSHSDIGGGYNPVGSPMQENESLFLSCPEFEIVSDDTRETDTRVYRKAEKVRELLVSLPALKYLLPHGKITTKTRSVGVMNSNQRRSGGIQKQVGASVFFERMAIPNEWASVCLRVMLDAAKEAGVVFEEIQENDEKYSLPPELKVLCDKAIAQGKSVRLGQVPQAFTEEERLLIGKYTHCSAKWNIESDRNLWVDPKTGEIFIHRFGPKEDKAFVFPNKPNDHWVRSVWYMDDQQRLNDNAVKNDVVTTSTD
ncbi:T6SS phospholipase effector Tle1-like catalytic domain-containing protein [Serratia quinivorans]|uniref:T6SS phospholipase effector Tle1-like catalytic domain-containing protein n=1 Tax=Serratia quinivorans TaxID=137545 RepID=UPI003F9A03C6